MLAPVSGSRLSFSSGAELSFMGVAVYLENLPKKIAINGNTQ